MVKQAEAEYIVEKLYGQPFELEEEEDESINHEEF